MSNIISNVEVEFGVDEEESKEETLDSIIEEEFRKLKNNKLVNRESVTRLERECQFIDNEESINIKHLSKIFALPTLDKTTPLPLTLKSAKRELDKNNFGMTEEKEIILDFVSSLRNSKKQQPIKILLVGPPGVGKSTLAISMAKVFNRKYSLLSCSGQRDFPFLKGWEKSYKSSKPGKIVETLIGLNTSSPMIIFDEIDKFSSDDINSSHATFYELLDDTTNKNFHDNYIDIGINTSNIAIVATANNLELLPEPIIDRFNEIIHVSPYSIEEKIEISKKFIIKNCRKLFNLSYNQFSLSTKSLEFIIKGYTDNEPGIRSLKYLIEKIGRKISRRIQERKLQKTHKFSIDKLEIIKLLGHPNFKNTECDPLPPGCCLGVGVCEDVGDILPIEVLQLTSQIEEPICTLTGEFKKTTEESVWVALSVIRSNLEEFGLTEDDISYKNFHIHSPTTVGNGVDGPSVGCVLLVAMLSAIKNKSVSNELVITGALNLRGQIEEIGGLREKIIGASINDKKKFIFPAQNENNFLTISDRIPDMEYIMVQNIFELVELVGLG